MHEHVLVVEDDHRISDAIGRRLSANGYRVSVAADVAEATEHVLVDTPDVALMDINLPDGNGVSLAARMRLLRSTIDVPIIFVTASRDPAHRERARALGIPLLEKPFPANVLLDAIAGALGTAHPSPAPAPAPAPASADASHPSGTIGT